MTTRTLPPPDANGWYKIDETPPPPGETVDLWREGERLVDFALDVHGRWSRYERYPEVRRVLTVQPTHWRPRPLEPVS